MVISYRTDVTVLHHRSETQGSLTLQTFTAASWSGYCGISEPDPAWSGGTEPDTHLHHNLPQKSQSSKHDD